MFAAFGRLRDRLACFGMRAKAKSPRLASAGFIVPAWRAQIAVVALRPTGPCGWHRQVQRKPQTPCTAANARQQ